MFGDLLSSWSSIATPLRRDRAHARVVHQLRDVRDRVGLRNYLDELDETAVTGWKATASGAGEDDHGAEAPPPDAGAPLAERPGGLGPPGRAPAVVTLGPVHRDERDRYVCSHAAPQRGVIRPW